MKAARRILPCPSKIACNFLQTETPKNRNEDSNSKEIEISLSFKI